MNAPAAEAPTTHETRSIDNYMLTFGSTALGASLDARGNQTPRRHKVRRAAGITAAMIALPFLMASKCELPHMDNSTQVEAPGDEDQQGTATIPPGGTACGGINTVRVEFDCGNGISGIYRESFGSGHYHVDHNGQRVAAGDPSFPVNDAVDIDGMCLLIVQANEDVDPVVQLYQQTCDSIG
jgi:hypothetical protein